MRQKSVRFSGSANVLGIQAEAGGVMPFVPIDTAASVHPSTKTVGRIGPRAFHL